MRKMVGRLAALAAACALTFVMLPIGGASAGTNGQNVSFCAPPGIEWGGLTGYNQDGAWTSESDLKMFFWGSGGALCTTSWWWWKGSVVIWYKGPDGWYPDRFCPVPESMNGDNFWC
jgi:hypothetical protein